MVRENRLNLRRAALLVAAVAFLLTGCAAGPNAAVGTGGGGTRGARSTRR
jgi:hypothetical protein